MERKAKIIAVLAFSFLLISSQSSAQEKKLFDVRITISVKDKPFEEVLSILESQIPFKFAYSTELTRQLNNVSVTAADMSLPDLLTIVLQGTSLTYTIIGDQIVLQRVVMPVKVTLSGYIRDARTGESLTGASVYVASAGSGTTSNNYGFYSLTIPFSDTIDVAISYVGYKSQLRQVKAHSSSTQIFGLDHNYSQEEIGKLTIAQDKREDNVKRNQPALIELSSNMISLSPSLSGGGDVLGSIYMLPGVQIGLDGTAGYSVRGGNTGQNLVLLDEASLYNPSHLFWLISVFNPTAVKNASLLKGGFPVTYGDHISSVLDVSMKDGSNQQTGGAIQMGTMASSMTLYGPLQPGKSSFLITARRSSIDWVLHPLTAHNYTVSKNQDYFNNYYFYDVNAKMNFRLSGRDRLFGSFYTGRDYNAYSTDSTDSSGINYSMHFGNSAFSLRWNHVYSGKLFSNTSLVYNRYHQFLSATQDGYFAQLYSGIRDINVKTDFSYYPAPSHKVSIGASYLHQTLYPALVSYTIAGDSGLSINPDAVPEKMAHRMAFYASDDIKLGRHMKAYLGVRVPAYYSSDVKYIDPEPRLSLLYLFNTATSVKVSYSQMHQYIHLVQSYNASFPAEIWIGSSPLVRPQISREISAGIYKNFKENIFQTSLEFYYRQMANQLLFKGGTSPVIDANPEDKLIFGKGWSYGTEFLVRKNRGRWTGWLAYTFAYAWQQFDSLNLGQSFPFAYDRRHSLSVSTSYTINNHWQVSANFLATSGRAFTLNTNTGTASQPSNPLYEDDNNSSGPSGAAANSIDNYRLAPYNRLDASISYKKSWDTRRRVLEAEWVFSVYNVYARRNTYFSYRAIDPSTSQPVAKEVSFIPVIPSISFNLKF